MSHRRQIVLVVGALARVALCAPAAALAGTYSWNQPGDFTGTQGTLRYGQPSWTYDAGSRGSLTPLTFNSGLQQWNDSSGESIAVSGSALVMQAAANKSVTLAWPDPFTQSQSVTVTYTDSLKTPFCLGSSTVTDQNGTAITSGTPVTLPAHGAVYTTVSGGALLACSADVSIQIQAINPTATISLDSLGSRPLQTDSPTFTGMAGAGSPDSKSVTLVIFPGADPSGSPSRSITGSASPNGSFSISVAPGLPAGLYTAVAWQSAGDSVGFSNPVSFTIKVHPPALTVSHPLAGASIPRSRVFFSGRAGSEVGDSTSITIYLYRGGKARGKALGKKTVSANRSSWSAGWGKLKDGIYTLRAVQTDNAGHTTRITHTFLVVPAPTTIGSSVTLSRSGIASVPISCLAPSGVFCNGTVLVLTARDFHTTPGGPSGPLRVLFSYVQIPGGTTLAVRGVVSKPVLGVLRSAKGVNVRVTTTLSTNGGPANTQSAERSLQLK